MKQRSLDIHRILTSLLGLLIIAAYILWIALESECPTDEFILVALCVPMCFLLAAHGVASRWPVVNTSPTLYMNVKPIISIVVGYISAFVAYQVVMASYGYSRHWMLVAAEAIIWVLIVVLTLCLRIYGVAKFIENDMD